MKTLITVIFAITLLSPVAAFSSQDLKKDPAKISFHSKIDKSAKSQAQLEAEMKQLMNNEDSAFADNWEDSLPQQQQVVSDFIDVEVHWGGKHEKLVDRRRN
jgi:hypothetical protein